ncbi:MAG: hypothetical protein IJ778_04575 [Alphaproteobacteria bacterium]|nr:hypothetical protein [Alphaproteobacteria bacterium]
MYKKLLETGVCLLFILSATQANAAKGLHAEHLQTGIENKKHPQVRENPQPLLPKRQHNRIDWDKILKLNKQQEAEINAIYNESAPKIAELRSQIHEAHRQIGEIYKEDDQKIREILDEQQRIKFDKYQYLHAKRAGRKPEGERPSRKKMSGY